LYDTPAYRAEVQSWFEALHLPWRWVPTTVASLAPTLTTICAPGQTAPALVCNLCDGDAIHGYPGLTVVRALEQAGIPFTGATSAFYALTTSKVPMKERLRQCGIATPPWARLGNDPDEISVGQLLRLARVPVHQLLASVLEDALVRFQTTRQSQGHGP